MERIHHITEQLRLLITRGSPEGTYPNRSKNKVCHHRNNSENAKQRHFHVSWKWNQSQAQLLLPKAKGRIGSCMCGCYRGDLRMKLRMFVNHHQLYQ